MKRELQWRKMLPPGQLQGSHPICGSACFRAHAFCCLRPKAHDALLLLVTSDEVAPKPFPQLPSGVHHEQRSSTASGFGIGLFSLSPRVLEAWFKLDVGRTL